MNDLNVSRRRKSPLIVPQDPLASQGGEDSSSDPSPKVPARKKLKATRVHGSDSDDEDNVPERNERASRATPTGAADAHGIRRGAVMTRGVRQPLKRGGKRF